MFGMINPQFLLEMRQMADDEDVHIDYTCAQILGQRLEQEDRYLVVNHIYGMLAVVCDGHGGYWTADDVILNVAKFVNEEYEAVCRKVGRLENLTVALEKQVMRKVCKRLHQITKRDESGTTLSMVSVRPIQRSENNKRQLRVVMSVLGDSPVSLYNGENYVHMPLHAAKYCNRDRERIERSGVGYFRRSYMFAKQIGMRESPGLAMTRALGDQQLDGVLIRQPSVKCIDVETTAVVVLGSDGLLSRDDPRAVKYQMRSIISRVREGYSAQEIIKILGDRNDNATLITMRFSEET